jgi:hypothetical protein
LPVKATLAMRADRRRAGTREFRLGWLIWRSMTRELG